MSTKHGYLSPYETNVYLMGNQYNSCTWYYYYQSIPIITTVVGTVGLTEGHWVLLPFAQSCNDIRFSQDTYYQPFTHSCPSCTQLGIRYM